MSLDLFWELFFFKVEPPGGSTTCLTPNALTEGPQALVGD